MKDTQEEMCPHIGLKDDPATSAAYPSVWNYCYRAKPIAIASLDNQRMYCLTAAYTACPLFLKPESTPVPTELQAQDLEPDRRSRAMRTTVSALVVLAVLVAVAVWQGIMRGFFYSPSQQGGGVSASTLTALPALPTIAIGSATHPSTPAGGVSPATPTPTFVPTKISSPIPTTQPVLNLALEVPIGLGQRFMIHRVMEGESLELFARRYATTVEAIQAVNYYLPSPLLVNWTMIIPLESIDVPGLPAFQPIIVVDDMTVEEFAQSNSVDVSTLSYFNGLEVSYRLTRGDWLLVPREKLNP